MSDRGAAQAGGRSGCLTFSTWIVVTLVGEGLGAAFAVGLAALAGNFEPGEQPAAWIALGGAAGALFGAAIGAAQWLVLRRLFPRATGWIVATMTSWLVAGLLFAATERAMCGWSIGCQGSDRYDALFTAGCVALSVGGALATIAQWLILRKRARGAQWWSLLALGAVVPWLLGNYVGLGVIAWWLAQPFVAAYALTRLAATLPSV